MLHSLKLVFAAVTLLMSILVFTGCEVSVPVQENQPPETLGVGSVRFKVGGGTTPVIGFDAGGNATNGGGVFTINESFGLDIGILEHWDVQGYYSMDSPGSAGTAGLKYQWMGESYFKEKAGTWASSLSAKAIFASMPSYNSGGSTVLTSYYENVNGNGFEASDNLGYRLTGWMGFYFGPKVVNLTLSGLVDPNGSGTFTQENRNVTGYGGFFGIYLNPHTETAGIELTLEVEDMNFPGSFSGGRVWYPPTFSASLGVPLHL